MLAYFCVCVCVAFTHMLTHTHTLSFAFIRHTHTSVWKCDKYNAATVREIKKKIIVSFYESDVWISAAETMEETGKIQHIWS